jgi:hypothetical protein
MTDMEPQPEDPPRPESSPATAGQPPVNYPPPYPYGYVPQPPYNTCAILAIVFAFAVFAPLGIYFGHKAQQEIARTGERGIELARVGVIGGWVISGLQATILCLMCGMIIYAIPV